MAQDLLRSDLMFEGTEKNLTIYAGQTLSKARAEISASEPQFFWPGITGSLLVTSQGSKISPLPLLLESVSGLLLSLGKREWNNFSRWKGKQHSFVCATTWGFSVWQLLRNNPGSAQQGFAPEMFQGTSAGSLSQLCARNSLSGLNVLVLPSPAPPVPV